MRRFILVSGLAAFAAVAPAQQVLQCVNPDVLNSLVFNARSESRLVVRRDMPENVAGFRAPAGFTLIGSGVRGQGLSTLVAYKTTLERDKAFDSLLGFLSGEGWNRETRQLDQVPSITVAGTQSSAATLCRNGDRRNVQVQEIGGVRYAVIAGFVTSPERACGAPDPRQGFSANPMAAMNAVRAVMPQFSFPSSARATGGAPSGDMTGGDETVSSVRIETPDTAATLAGNLARQLREQGWRSDAEWKGALSTGSTWMRGAGAGQTYWGKLEILNLGNGILDISYSVATGSR